MLRLQLVKFPYVGIVNTLMSYGIFCIFVYFGLGFKVASLFSIFFVVAFSFFMQGRLVFHGVSPINFLRYIITWVALYFLNIKIITFCIVCSLVTCIGFNIIIIPLLVAVGCPRAYCNRHYCCLFRLSFSIFRQLW